MTTNPGLRLSDPDVPALIDAWQSAAHDFLALCESLDADQWALPTPCPGWSVGDVAAHIAAIDAELLGDPAIAHEPDWASLPHVRDDDFSRYTEAAVDARRGRAQREVLDELADVTARRALQLSEGDQDPAAEATGPMGRSRPLELALRMRTFDTWVHEQDVRTAVGQPGNEGSAGAEVSAHTLVGALPFALGKRLGAAPGTSLRLVVSGAVSFDRTVAVGDDGRAGFVDSAPGADGSTVTLRTDWMTFVRLGTGRGDPAALRALVTVEGDLNLGERYLSDANVAP